MNVKLKDRKKVLDKKRLRNSFKYAFEGVATAYKTEQNLRIHTIVAILVVIFGFLFKISHLEWFICLILIGLVLMAEFFNTALENIVDMITMDINPYAKKAKDMASSGVLAMALISAIVGLIIFIPKFIHLIGGVL